MLLVLIYCFAWVMGFGTGIIWAVNSIRKEVIAKKKDLKSIKVSDLYPKKD